MIIKHVVLSKLSKKEEIGVVCVLHDLCFNVAYGTFFLSQQQSMPLSEKLLQSTKDCRSTGTQLFQPKLRREMQARIGKPILQLNLSPIE